VTSVPSNPMISNWPTDFAAEFDFCAGLIRNAISKAYQDCAVKAPVEAATEPASSTPPTD
jgi:hypothetical protein